MQPNPILDQPMQADIDFVVREFSNHVRRNEIKQSMMERRGLSWNEAEEFVSYVEQHHRHSIAARQMPFLVFLAIASLISGCALLGYTLWLLRFGIPRNPLMIRPLLWMLGTSAAMLIGGVVGLVQTLTALYK